MLIVNFILNIFCKGGLILACKLRKMRAQLIDPITKKPVEDVDILTSAGCVYFDDGETFEEKWARGDFKGEHGEPGEDGVNATIQVGKVVTVVDPQDAAVENVGTKHAAVLDIYLPQGEPGKDGTSIKILGRFETYEELVAAYPDGSDIDGGFLVGPEGGPCDYYFWNRRTFKWESLGPIRGEKGDKGETGAPGMGLAVFDTVENYDALIEKYPDGSVCNGMGVITLDTGEYWYWNIIRNEWDSIGRITGVPGSISIYKVNTIDPTEEASVINVGTDTHAQLIINIPRGMPGSSADIKVDQELISGSTNPVAGGPVADAILAIQKSLKNQMDELLKLKSSKGRGDQKISDMLKLI